MRNNRHSDGRARFFDELTPFANAIRALPRPDALSAEVSARDEDDRKRAAEDKRARKAARRIAERAA